MRPAAPKEVETTSVFGRHSPRSPCGSRSHVNTQLDITQPFLSCRAIGFGLNAALHGSWFSVLFFLHDSSFLLSSDLLNERTDQSNDGTSPSASVDIPASATGPSPKWPPAFLSRQPASGVRTFFPPSLAWARPREAPVVVRRVRRARRQAHAGTRGHHHPHHGQLMRVGCVLGTCQVQNLSHRLYQLIGQGGREDSSPINPRSPHSFG